MVCRRGSSSTGRYACTLIYCINKGGTVSECVCMCVCAKIIILLTSSMCTMQTILGSYRWTNSNSSLVSVFPIR